MKNGILLGIGLLLLGGLSTSLAGTNLDRIPDITTTESSVTDVLEEARRLIRQKRFEAAYELLQGAREDFSGSAEWMRLIIQVDDHFIQKYGQSRLYAIDRLTYVLTLDPTDRRTRFELADRLTEAGRFYEAEQVLAAQQYIDPDDSESQIRLDALSASKNNVAYRRIQQLERQTAANPRDVQAFRQLGHFYSVVGDVSGASRAYDKAIQFAPADLGLRFEYAQMLSDAGQYAQALNEAEYLLSLQPNNARYKNLYASAALFSGISDARTERYVQDALNSDSGNLDYLANLALLRIYQGRIDEADQIARRAQTLAGSTYVPRLEELDDLILEARSGVGSVNRVMIDRLPGQQQAPINPPRVRETQEIQVDSRVDHEEAVYFEDVPVVRGSQNVIVERVVEDDFLQPAAPVRQDPLPDGALNRYHNQIAEHYAPASGQRIIRSSQRCDQTLAQARTVYHESRFFDAADLYEEYFRCSGNVTPELLIEMSNSIEAGGDAVSAISVLQAAQQYRRDDNIAMRMAQMRYDMNDVLGARELLTGIVKRNPHNVDALVLLGDTFAREGYQKTAYDAYHDAHLLDPENLRIRKRLAWTKRPVGGNGYDYAVLINPYIQGVRAIGFDTEYNRLSMGVETQVTLPIPIVLTAGFASHGVKGTRFQARPGIRNFKPGFEGPIPEAEEWFNQVSLGAFWDITPALPYRMYGENYTNRLSARGGIYDYSGGRTAPFGSVYFRHQRPESYTLSLGVEVNEGSIALWAPGGAEDKLRLTQYSVSLGSDHMFNGRLRGDAAFNYNVVDDAFTGVSNRNEGIGVSLDLGVKVLRNTFFGAGYYLLNYEHPTNFYFSPTNYNYQEYALWIEQEYADSDVSYFRLRGTGGVIGPTDFGFVRGQLDWLYRLRNNFAVGVNAQASQAFRYRNRNGQSQNTYTILFGGVSLFWTL